MNEKILIVDDDFNTLSAYARSLGSDFSIDTAQDGREALAVISSRGPYAVVVSDFRMPVMDGIQFLACVREIAPASVRIIVTAYADLRTAVDAINEGYVYKFLNKPCQSEVLSRILKESMQEYQLSSRQVGFTKAIPTHAQILTQDLLSVSNQTQQSKSNPPGLKSLACRSTPDRAKTKIVPPLLYAEV